MVQIAIQTSDTPQYCGGSLLNERWILTAAHCFKRMISARAYLGSVFWRSMKKMKIIDVVIHPSYLNVNGHDIALAKLERNVNFTENIQPVSLPSENESMPNETLFVAGFGETKNASQSILNLRFVSMKEISNEECSKIWGWKMSDAQLCAVGVKSSNHTTCKGDSGSSIIRKTENKTIALGITSYGAPGCIGKAKVFTRISSYLDFIYAVTKIDLENNESF